MPTAPPSVDVLLAEADHELSTHISRALRARGITVDVAGGTTEAKRLLARNAYKVAVLALMFSDGSGFDVIDFIRAANIPTMHTIVITAAAPSALEQIDRSVVKTVFFKPLNIEHVAAHVQTVASYAAPSR